MRRRRAAAAVLTGTLALTACAGGGDDAASVDAPAAFEEGTAEASGGDIGAFIATDNTGEDGSLDSAAQAEDTGGGFDIGAIGRDVIIEMRVVLSSDDIQRTVASVMAAASTLGGGVASSDVNYGEAGDLGSQGFAVLVVKVPPESVDRLLDGLDDTATVQSINQSAQDVTEQLVNLDVRIENARRSVTNVREFMDRTENITELVTLEAELTRRQTELEQLEAQQRNLADRVALSTVTIEVIPSASVPEPVVDEDETIGDALASGWDAFTAVLFGLGFVLAATLPFLITGLLLSFVLWMVVRRRDASTTAPHERIHHVPPPESVTADEVAEPEREPEPTG